MRRLIDWSGNSYTSVSLISIAPIAATASLIIPVGKLFWRLRGRLRLAVILFAVAMCYGLAVGVVRHGASAATVEFAGWASPLLVFPYLAVRRENHAERLLWINAVALLGMSVALYAWWQFLLAPEWDMDWLVSSGMTSSMGQPHAMSFRAFSSLNSTGTAALFFAFVVGLVWTVKELRNLLGFLIAFVSATALVITQVRTGWVMAAIFICGGMILRSGGSWLKQVMVFGLLAGVLVAGTKLLPGGDQIEDRVNSFGDLQGDRSAGVRRELLQMLVEQVVRDPLGTGFGAAAEGKVSGGSNMVNDVDNGYGVMFLDFGLIGGVLILIALWLIVLEVIEGYSSKDNTDRRQRTFVPLAMTSLFAIFAANISGNMFTGLQAITGWMFCGLMFSLSPLPQSASVRRAIQATGTALVNL
jgi:hypothetical protein